MNKANLIISVGSNQALARAVVNLLDEMGVTTGPYGAEYLKRILEDQKNGRSIEMRVTEESRDYLDSEYGDFPGHIRIDAATEFGRLVELLGNKPIEFKLNDSYTAVIDHGAEVVRVKEDPSIAVPFAVVRKLAEGLK